MLWIFFLLLALVFLGGGGAASYLHHTGRLAAMWPAVVPYLRLIKNLVISLGAGFSLLGLALLYRKVARMSRALGGRDSSGRVRRARMSTRVSRRAHRDRDEDEEAGPDEDADSDKVGTRKLHRLELGDE